MPQVVNLANGFLKVKTTPLPNMQKIPKWKKGILSMAEKRVFGFVTIKMEKHQSSRGITETIGLKGFIYVTTGMQRKWRRLPSFKTSIRVPVFAISVMVKWLTEVTTTIVGRNLVKSTISIRMVNFSLNIQQKMVALSEQLSTTTGMGL
jgi:hypothetical protein